MAEAIPPPLVPWRISDGAVEKVFVSGDPFAQAHTIVGVSEHGTNGLDVARQDPEIGHKGEIDDHGGADEEDKDAEAEEDGGGRHDQLLSGRLNVGPDGGFGVRRSVRVMYDHQVNSISHGHPEPSQIRRQLGCDGLECATTDAAGDVDGCIVLEKGSKDILREFREGRRIEERRRVPVSKDVSRVRHIVRI